MEGHDLSLADERDVAYRGMAAIVYDKGGEEPQQKCFDRREMCYPGEEKRPPIFSKEEWSSFTDKPTRHYTFCSYRKMYEEIHQRRMTDRTFYEIIFHGDPCHFYLDADLAFKDVKVGTRKPDMGTAVATMLRLLDQARGIIYEHGKDPAWDFKWADVIVSELCADSPVKDSRHLVLHMPNLRMCANGHEHGKRWFLMAIDLSRKEFGHDDNNPMFFCNVEGKAQCICDVSVYTPNRTFRMIGNAKIKELEADIGAHLWPACPHAADISCIDANCRYKVQNTFSEYDFLSNLVTFVPLQPDGRPQVPMLLCVPDVFDHNLAKSRRGKWSTMKDKPLLAAGQTLLPYSFWAGGGGDSNHSVATPASKADRVPMKPADDSVRPICEEIASMLSRQTRHACEYLYTTEKDVHVFSSTDQMCQLIGREHGDNHISITCKLALPFPTFSVMCLHPKCLNRTRFHPDMTPEERSKLERVVLQPDKDIFAPLVPRIEQYILKQTLTADMLLLGF